MSDSTLKTVVSVEWLRRYADCIVGIKPDSSRYASSLMATRRSSIFDITDKFEMGRCNEVHLNYVKCIIVYTHITLALYRLD